MTNKLICIVGPTATGKSELGTLLAEKLSSQIISGDSMLVYKQMDIGTAKPSQDELNKTPHHLINILEPDQEYSAALFQQQASELITKINSQNQIPLLVGGTGLYIKALLEGYKFATTAKSKLRAQLEQLPAQQLFNQLNAQAPHIAQTIHPNNKKRLIRALELELSGQSISKEKQPQLIYDTFVIGLTMSRQTLYQKINKRVETMMQQGLVKEVETLLQNGISPDTTSMQAIGYKEIVQHLNGQIDLPTCQTLIAQNTRHFAKRQITWYKKMPYINWYEVDNTPNLQTLANNIYCELEKKFKLR